jgi:hypothetical protein
MGNAAAAQIASTPAFEYCGGSTVVTAGIETVLPDVAAASTCLKYADTVTPVVSYVNGLSMPKTLGM